MSAPTSNRGRAPLARSARTVAGLFAAAALVTGCYASSVLDEATSGSRLRAQRWVPESGERAFAGWFDTELGRDCVFAWLEGGGHRCVPLFDARPGPTHYADAACTEPVVQVAADSACAVDRDFAYSLVEQPERVECTGAAQLRFYELEGPMSVSRAFVLRDGECTETTSPPDQVRRARRMAPERFVGAETVAAPEPGRGRLRRERLVADDGSVQLGAFFDHERGEACRAGAVVGLTTIAMPCLPFSAANLVSCATDWAPHAEACGRPAVAYRPQPGTCTSVGEVRVFSVADELETFAEECRGTTEGYAITGDGADRLAWITPAAHGEGRLQPIVWVDVDGAALSGGDGTYLDTELGFRCRPHEMADGVTRCVPGIAETWVHRSADTFQPGRGPYADAACTQPAVGLTPGCDAEIEWVHETAPLAECPLAYRIAAIRPVGERVDAAYLRDPDTGECVPYDLGSARETHRLGPALEADRLARVELVED